MITKIIATILIGLGSIFGITQNKDSNLTLGAFSDPFLSVQLASSPVSTYCLKTDGTNNSWSPTCGSGGGGSGGGTWSTTTSNVANQLINYPNNTTDIVTIGSTATTTAKAFFDPNIGVLQIGTSSSAAQLSAFGNGYYPLQVYGNIGDIVGQTIWNTNKTSISAGSGLFLNGGNTPIGGIGALGTYYAGFVLTGPGWNGIPLGFGAAQANDAVVYNTDGSLILASATSTMGLTNAIKFFVGAGSFSGGIPDMLLSALGNLGIGTSTASSRLTIHANVGDTNTLLLSVGSSTKTATTSLLVLDNKGSFGLSSSSPSAKFSLNSTGTGTGRTFVLADSNNVEKTTILDNGNIGIGTTSPLARFDIKDLTSQIALSVDGGGSGVDIARFFRDNSTPGGMGVSFNVAGSLDQIDFKSGLSPGNGGGLLKFALIYDPANNSFNIGTTTSATAVSYAAKNGIEPFQLLGTSGFIGLGTSTPYGRLSINPGFYDGNSPAFVIGSSTSNGTNFIVNSSGNTGLGVTNVLAKLHVREATGSGYTANQPLLFLDGAGSSASSYVAQFSASSGTGNSYPSFNLANNGATILNSQSSLIGYGTTASFSGSGANARGQLVITNGASATNWFNVFVDTSTNANLSANGPIRIFRTLGGTSDIFNIASSTGGLASSTYVTVNGIGNFGIGTSSPVTKLAVSGGAIYSVENVPATSTSISVNLATTSNQVLIQLGTSATTITLDNILAGMGTRLITCNPNASAGAVTFTTNPAGLLLWTGGSVPSQTTTANKCDVWTFTATQGTSTSLQNVKIFGAQVPNF